jgi:hypothetical protein
LKLGSAGEGEVRGIERRSKGFADVSMAVNDDASSFCVCDVV